VKLIPQLEKLKPGSRIVSHDFDMEGVKPKQTFKMKVKGEGKGSASTLSTCGRSRWRRKRRTTRKRRSNRASEAG